MLRRVSFWRVARVVGCRLFVGRGRGRFPFEQFLLQACSDHRYFHLLRSFVERLHSLSFRFPHNDYTVYVSIHEMSLCSSELPHSSCEPEQTTGPQGTAFEMVGVHRVLVFQGSIGVLGSVGVLRGYCALRRC